MHRAVRQALTVLVATVALCATGTEVRAAALDAGEVLAQMEGADPALQTYRADVEFSVGLYSFPYLRKTVHGEAFFKRPGRVELVFHDLPAIAQRFRNVYLGLGSAAEWRKKFDITAAEQTLGGQSVACLTLIPKIADRRLKQVDIYLDPPSSLPSTFVWRYSDGTIRMTQHIAEVGGHHIVTAQAADFKLPGVHGFVNTKLTNVQVNAEFADAVFTQRI